MTDLLVKLYDLQDPAPQLAALAARGIVVRRAVTSEKRLIVAWVAATFPSIPTWVSECEAALSTAPATCFIATEHGRLIGFACHDAFAYKNMFGPTGVAENHRGQGIGTALLLVCLHAMAAQGYAYGIIAWAGPVAFYQQAVGAIVIPGPTPPVYGQLLSDPEAQVR